MAFPDRLKQEVMEIVADVAECELDEVSENSTLEEQEVDSLGGLRIVAEVEKKYKIVVAEEAIGKIRTMQEIFALVLQHAPEVHET